jgi:hypothetical protein
MRWKTYLLRTAIAMLLLPVAHAATTPPATVTGTLQTPAGTPALNTFARFELTYCGGNMGRVTGASLVAFVPFDVHTNSSGVYSTSLFGNDQITCGATLGLSRWRITPYFNGVAGPAYTYQIESNTTFTVDAAVACTVSVITNCVSDLRPVAPIPPAVQSLAGTSTNIGGSALAAGACAVGTATITGATVGMPAVASPTDGSLPGASFKVDASVTAANTVTVEVCAVSAGTPAAEFYSVRVLQ